MHSARILVKLPAKLSTGVLTGLLLTAAANAAQLQVFIKDKAGQPVAETVVVATSLTPSTSRSQTRNEPPAVMDQQNKLFVPEVLVVRTGTPVIFPNSDSIAHQVYSFSPAKQFALPLYRGRPHPPVIFDHAGLVVLGCNIHDQMIGYIYVTDSPHFAKSNAQGFVGFNDLPSGRYTLTMWHPRADESLAPQEISLSDGEVKQAQVRFQRALRPKPRSTESRIRDY